MDYQKLPEFISSIPEGLEKTPDRICGYLKSKAGDLRVFEDCLRAVLAKSIKDKAVRDFLFTYFMLVYLEAVALPAISPSKVSKFSYRSVPFLSILAKIGIGFTVNCDMQEDTDNSPHFTPSQE